MKNLYTSYVNKVSGPSRIIYLFLVISVSVLTFFQFQLKNSDILSILLAYTPTYLLLLIIT